MRIELSRLPRALTKSYSFLSSSFHAFVLVFASCRKFKLSSIMLNLDNELFRCDSLSTLIILGQYISYFLDDFAIILCKECISFLAFLTLLANIFASVRSCSRIFFFQTIGDSVNFSTKSSDLHRLVQDFISLSFWIFSSSFRCAEIQKSHVKWRLSAYNCS